MSSEGKAKRGTAGASNAKSIAHRTNGWPVDWYMRRIGAYQGAGAPSSGSTTMRGMLGGMLAEGMGFRLHGDANAYERMLAHAEPRCSSAILRI